MMKRLSRIAVICGLLLFVSGAMANVVCAEPAAGNNVTEWQKWITSKGEYLSKVELLMKEVREAVVKQNAALQEAIKNNDTELGTKAINETTQKLSAVVAELKLLNPPEEFKEYHTSLIEAYQYRQTANEATLKNDTATIKEYGNKTIASELAAIESVRKLYSARGAPQQLMDSLDKTIATAKERLAAMKAAP